MTASPGSTLQAERKVAVRAGTDRKLINRAETGAKSRSALRLRTDRLLSALLAVREDLSVLVLRGSRKARMNNGRILYMLCAAVSLLAMPSCSRPVTAEQFIRNPERDAWGRYAFDIDMTDSTSVYDISLISAFSCIDRDFSSFRSMPLHLMWESPDGRLFEDNVVLRRDVLRDSSYYDKVLADRLGEGLSPVENGRWRLYVKADEDSLRKYGMTGMGIRVDRKQRQDNGTR